MVVSGLDVLQADSDARAAAARHAIMSFFINKIFVYIVSLQY